MVTEICLLFIGTTFCQNQPDVPDRLTVFGKFFVTGKLSSNKAASKTLDFICMARRYF